MGGWGVCRLVATHVVSSDLTSHIPAQEGWSLRWRGRGLEGAGFIGMEGGGTKKLGLGAAGNLKVLCNINFRKPESTSCSPGPQSLCLSSHFALFKMFPWST